MREVSAARETFHAAHAVKIVGNAREESSARHQQQEKVADAGGFSIPTMWASGKQSSLQWLSANVTFRYKEHESPPYIEIDGLDTKYRILPDAVVATERINGMQTMWVVGWQAYRENKGQFGSSHYSKDEALYFRTELNPVVGQTKAGFFRSAGHKIYEHKTGDKIIRYFLNSKTHTEDRSRRCLAGPIGRAFCFYFGVSGYRKRQTISDNFFGASCKARTRWTFTQRSPMIPRWSSRCPAKSRSP